MRFSSRSTPAMTGTRFTRPVLSACRSVIGSVVPFRVGATVPCAPYWYPEPGREEASETVCAGTARKHAATSGALPHPTAAANPAPMLSASASVGSFDLQSWSSRSSEPPGRGASATPKSVLYSPLVLIALWNSPAAVGDAIWWQTLDPPADSPKMVTLCGSP